MAYDGTELEGTPLGGVWARGVRIVEREEVVEVDNGNDNDYWCRVRSQTREDTYHDVHNTAHGWTCRCESYRLGHKVCQHMVAAFILAASGSRVSKEKPHADFNLPERWCRHCGSTHATWSESRPLKRMSAARDVGSVDRYGCNACGRRFADRPGFEGRHYTEDVILSALRMVARDMVPKDAADTIKEEKGVAVSGRTIQRWVDGYPEMVAAFAKDLEIKGCEAVSVDEKHYKSRGRARWMARAMCVKTRFILASDHWPDKLNHDATPLIEKIVERLGGPPLLLISDKLPGYRKGYNNVLRAAPRTTMHVADAAVKNRHVNNNRHERQNGETQRCKANRRGFNSDAPGLFVLNEIYHNFLRPHMGLGGATPAEKAGIHVPGPDKLLTLIRCAAASRFNFA